ncbi:MAG: hypothetical protein L0H96_10040 [Humibacillus sp.]|nr:hypothetical protein [Humibacillus sp.]MDN5777240.1 hypothetical protein [Humibacillus sp.]
MPTLFAVATGQPAMRREVDMMGLTVCLALLVSLVAGNDHEAHSKFDLIVIVWATTVGLVLTHSFALALSVRLVKDPAFVIHPGLLLLMQLAMATVVAVVTSAVVLLTSSEFDRLGARMSAAVFLGLLVGAEVRTGGSSWPRSLGWGLGAIGAALALATGKWFIGL